MIDLLIRAETASKRGKHWQAWHLYAEAANDATSAIKARRLDRLMAKEEWAMRHTRNGHRIEHGQQ